MVNINDLVLRTQKFIWGLFIGLLFLITSCHTSYVSLDFKIMHGAVWNADSTQVALIILKKAYHSPKGIARFPDGGMSKTLLSNVNLYTFNPENRALVNVSSLNKFPTGGVIKMAYIDSLIYCLFKVNWESLLYSAKTASDSVRNDQLKRKYANPIVFNEYSDEVFSTDSAIFVKVYQPEREIDYMTLHHQISEVPLSQLGLVIQDICPKSDNAYIDDFIYSSKGGSRLTKRAIAEQIISKLSKNEIEKIRRKIVNQEKRLDGFEQKKFEFYSKDKHELLNKLLGD